MSWDAWDFFKKTREIDPRHEDTLNDIVAHTKLLKNQKKFNNPKGSKFPKSVQSRRQN